MSILRQWAKKSFKQGATDFCSSQIEQDVNGKYEHSTWNNRLPLIIRSACMIVTIA